MSYIPPTDKQRRELLKSIGETERLVEEQERIKRTGISTTTWWRMSKKGIVPPHRKIGHKKFWRLSDILNFILTN